LSRTKIKEPALCPVCGKDIVWGHPMTPEYNIHGSCMPEAVRIILEYNNSEETNIEGKQMEKPNIERTKEELLEWGNLCLEECKSLQAHVFDLEENKE